VSIASVVLNVVLNLILVRTMGFRGLALGTSIAALFNAIVLLALLRRRLGGLEVGRIVETGTKITAAAIAMGFAVRTSHGWLVQVVEGPDLVSRLVQVFGSIGIGIAVLALGARLLRIAEWERVRELLLRRRAGS
jgi:putative peptidoglycan lipid II flippase